MSEILQKPSEVDLVAAIETNLYAQLPLWQRPGQDNINIHHEPDVKWIKTGRGHDFAAPMQHYVAYLEDRPVACATVFLGGGVAGIYTVGTVPEARRLGIGRAITLAARQAGYRYGILHASAAGLNVYRGLGFKEYCPIAIYAWTGEDEQD